MLPGCLTECVASQRQSPRMCGSSVNAARNPDVPLSAINRPARNYSDGCLSIYPKTGDAPLNCINCIFWASVNHAYRNQLPDGEFAIHENRSTEDRAAPRPRARYRRRVGVDHHRSRCRWSYAGNLVSNVEGDVADLIAGSASTPTRLILRAPEAVDLVRAAPKIFSRSADE